MGNISKISHKNTNYIFNGGQISINTALPRQSDNRSNRLDSEISGKWNNSGKPSGVMSGGFKLGK